MDWKKTSFFAIAIIWMIGLLVWISTVFVGFGGVNFFPNDNLTPTIQYAEFPFKLEYKINENSFIIEDVLVGEFVRINYNMGLGKTQRVWKAHLKSGKKYISLYLDNEKEIFYQPTEDPNIIGTFMGEDTVLDVEHLMMYPVTLCIREEKSEHFVSAEELNNVYNIQLISWEIAPPIENTFK